MIILLFFLSGYLFGVFDGHGGEACAQVIAKRLFHYITAHFLSHQQLQSLSEAIINTDSYSNKILEYYNERFDFVDVLKNLYANSFQILIKDLLSNTRENMSIETALEKSFLRLDDDISKEALEAETITGISKKTFSVAMSGAVSCVAYITGPNLYIANVGDCQAVIGRLADNGQWSPKTISIPHNTDNISEVKRILSEHPKSEENSVIKGERLLGHLAPLRAFGDFRYKWNKDLLEKMAGPYFGTHAVPGDYHTPPYLTAKPDIYHHHLTIKDKFLILATDGLWDFISPQQVVITKKKKPKVNFLL